MAQQRVDEPGRGQGAGGGREPLQRRFRPVDRLGARLHRSQGDVDGPVDRSGEGTDPEGSQERPARHRHGDTPERQAQQQGIVGRDDAVQCAGGLCSGTVEQARQRARQAVLPVQLISQPRLQQALSRLDQGQERLGAADPLGQ